MRPTRVAAVALVSFVALALASGPALNMPMFTRKYQIECGSCPLVVPKLTKMGMEFRAAGFRMPDDIGSEDKESGNISTQNSTRLQTRYDASRTDNAGVKSDKSRLTFHEITLYPLTGAFNKNYSSLFEISIAPEEPSEIENAYVRGDWKQGQGFVSGRVGIFHPFEGFGASDRPLAISRPLLQTTSANFNQRTFFTPWGFDEAGLELGYNVQNTSVRATLFSGITYDPNEGIAHPVQAGAGAFGKDPARSDFHDSDFQLFGSQVLNANGGGVSLYYYNGVVDLPVQKAVGSGDSTAFFKNKFQRYAAYASYPVVPKVILAAGAQQGVDKTFVATKPGFSDDSKSNGYFGEADVDIYEGAWLAGRFDWFDPSDQKDDNEIAAGTVAVNKPFNNGLQLIAEYQYKQTKQGTKADRKDNAFQTRLIWIW